MSRLSPHIFHHLQPNRTPVLSELAPVTPASATTISPLLPKLETARIQKKGIIEPSTGPFEPLKGRSVLVAADIENIDRSAQDLHHALDYHRLAQILRHEIGDQTQLIAVFSDNDPNAERVLREAGWATYVRPIDILRSKGRYLRFSNADVALATAVGAAAVALDEAICLASGDGQLLIDIGRCLKTIVPRIRLCATLSLPGSTSHRLDARRSNIIDLNVEIGADVLRPLKRKLSPRAYLNMRTSNWPVSGATTQLFA
jgi:hypothetical protein